MNFKNTQGFTLIELLIVTAVVAIIAVIAIPSYTVMYRKSHFAEVIQATAPFKVAVEQCYFSQGSPSAGVSNCASGTGGVPVAASISNPNAALAGMTISSNGVITATASTNFGLAGETYTLTPTPVNAAGGGNILIWTKGGTCVSAGYC